MSAQTKYAYGRCEAISALVQVATGLLNVLNWYGFGWFFPPVHRFLGYVLVGTANLTLLIGLIAGVTAVPYAVRVIRDRRQRITRKDHSGQAARDQLG
jgi:hypothetical protein